MAILTPQLYPAVRAAIDVGLDTAKLPDQVIALPIYAGAADLDVLARDPDAESRTEVAQQHVLNAAVYFCAARLIGALHQQIRESSAEGYGWQVTAWDPAVRAAELRTMALAEIDIVIDPPPADPVVIAPPFFVLAGPRRKL